MDAKDCLKAALILFGYIGLAPALGFLARGNRRAQRWLFGLLVFMTSWHINKLTLMIDSIEWYRGATKGFEFSLMIIVALALLIAIGLGPNRPRRWIAPGALLYVLYVAASWISIFAAPVPLYVNMAAWRFLQQAPIYVAAFHFLRDEEDFKVLLRSVSVTLCIQALVVVKMKYLDHIYQVWGWFEHQNALAMWAYMCGLPLFAAALGRCSAKDCYWYLAGYVASGIIVEAALARASLVAFVVGTAAVVLFSLIDGVTIRRIAIPAVMSVVAAIGLAFTLHTILYRFSENRNTESSELRQLLILSSKRMLEDSPIGIGWNNYAHVINRPYTYGDCIDQWTVDRGYTVDPDEAKPQPESHYWLLLAENGYPGFFAYMLFLVATTWWCLQAAWKWRKTLIGCFLAGLLIALVITYLHSTIERCLTQTKNVAMWLIFLGVAVRLKTTPRKDATPKQRLAATPSAMVEQTLACHLS